MHRQATHSLVARLEIPGAAGIAYKSYASSGAVPPGLKESVSAVNCSVVFEVMLLDLLTSRVLPRPEIPRRVSHEIPEKKKKNHVWPIRLRAVLRLMVASWTW